MSNPETNYQKWFAKADEDERSIQAIIKGGGAFSTACFLSQQMAEKYLKGLLVFLNHPHHKIHDLLELETLLLENISGIANLHEELKYLNRYYIETRYPGDYPEFTFEETRQAFEKAKKVKDLVLQLIENKK